MNASALRMLYRLLEEKVLSHHKHTQTQTQSKHRGMEILRWR